MVEFFTMGAYNRDIFTTFTIRRTTDVMAKKLRHPCESRDSVVRRAFGALARENEKTRNDRTLPLAALESTAAFGLGFVDQTVQTMIPGHNRLKTAASIASGVALVVLGAHVKGEKGNVVKASGLGILGLAGGSLSRDLVPPIDTRINARTDRNPEGVGTASPPNSNGKTTGDPPGKPRILF